MSTITTERRPDQVAARTPSPTTGTPVQHVVHMVAVWLTAHSITALRISLGLVILGFGALKFIPGASPAEGLVMRTTDVLTLGLVSGTAAVVATAVLETFIGFTLLTGIGLRVGLVATAGWLVGIMSPVVLFPADMFPDFFPTLEAQYVLKDVILAAAAAVVAAKELGARYVLDPDEA
ncbi:DoxX family protein [Aeromicrobium sp.]|uniref:DoxX family protein n=1 Tax=Aeromicrobium sp. TaxID=1871063 RepID=UPI003C57427A